MISASGSTGRAKKRVGASPAALVERCMALTDEQDLRVVEGGEVCCQKTAVGFVDAVFEHVRSVVEAAGRVIADEETGRDALQLLRLKCARRRCSTW